MSEAGAVDSLCGDCGTILVKLCPCCELGDGGRGRAASDTLAPHVSQAGERNRGKRRASSEPPPLPTLALVAKRSDLAERLISINQRSFGPPDALDLTDELLDDNEDLGQDQIDVLFNQ